MYIETRFYDKGLLTCEQIMSYRDSEELKIYKEFAETIKAKTALLSLSNDN